MDYLIIGDGLKVGQAWAENIKHEHEKFKLALEMVLKDLNENNSPCLSVATVRAVQSVEDLIDSCSDESSILERIKERAERILEGEEWDLATYCLGLIAGYDKS